MEVPKSERDSGHRVGKRESVALGNTPHNIADCEAFFAGHPDGIGHTIYLIPIVVKKKHRGPIVVSSADPEIRAYTGSAGHAYCIHETTRLAKRTHSST